MDIAGLQQEILRVFFSFEHEQPSIELREAFLDYVRKEPVCYHIVKFLLTDARQLAKTGGFIWDRGEITDYLLAHKIAPRNLGDKILQELWFLKNCELIDFDRKYVKMNTRQFYMLVGLGG